MSSSDHFICKIYCHLCKSARIIYHLGKICEHYLHYQTISILIAIYTLTSSRQLILRHHFD